MNNGECSTTRTMLVKVCGMREAQNIREVEALGIDLMGLIFWPRSSRYVSERPDYLPTQCKRVGVFVDEAVPQVVDTVDSYALHAVQLHGHESPDDIRCLRAALSTASLSPAIIKAFNIATATDLVQTSVYDGLVDAFLFDTKGRSVGGNGEKFDWSVLRHYTGDTPFLLSGGIGSDDAERVSAFRHPRCIGIDVNSRFECSPGKKDVEALSAFLQKVRR